MKESIFTKLHNKLEPTGFVRRKYEIHQQKEKFTTNKIFAHNILLFSCYDIRILFQHATPHKKQIQKSKHQTS